MHQLTCTLLILCSALSEPARAQNQAWVENAHIPTRSASRYGNASTFLSTYLHLNRSHNLVEFRWRYDSDGDVSAPHQSGLHQPFPVRYTPIIGEFVGGKSVLIGGVTSTGVGILEVWGFEEPTPITSIPSGEVFLLPQHRTSVTTIWVGHNSALSKPIFATHARGENAAFVRFQEYSDLMKVSWVPGVAQSATISVALSTAQQPLLAQPSLDRIYGATHSDIVTGQVRYIYWIHREGRADLTQTISLFDDDLDGVIEQHGAWDDALLRGIGFHSKPQFIEYLGSNFWF